MRWLITSVAVLAAMLASTASASAVLVVDVTGSNVSPNQAGEPSSLHIKGTLFDTTGVKPPPTRSVVVQFPPGARVDPTVPGFCDPAKLAAAGSCPKSSVVATGTSTIDVRFGGIDTLSADLTIYNVKPAAGEKAAFIIHAVEPAVTGIAADIRGRVVNAPGGGLQLELLDLDKQIPTVLGIQPAVIGTDVTTKRITKSVGARRQGKRKRSSRRSASRGRQVRSFSTNPPTCAGAWAVSGRFQFTDGQEILGSLSVPCRK